MTSAAEYIRQTSDLLEDRYTENCVVYACRAAELLLAESLAPWIGRVRDIEEKDGMRIHHALIPLRYRGRGAPTWTTHYVTCAGGQAYDPLIGEPIDIDRFTMEVFGRKLDVVEHFDVRETARLLAGGTLCAAFRPVV